jgi:ribosomal protein S18 acetylase RimI-like enzyme
MFKDFKTHLPKGFIGHKKSTEYGESLYIFKEDGSGLVRLEDDDDVKGDFWIMELSVSVGCREEGLGTVLMNIAENIALYNDATKIRLWVEKDKWMRSWYERLGFKDDGENDELGKITMTKYLMLKA